IGKDVPSNYRSLRTSAHGIGPIRQLDTPHRGKLLVGEVAVTNEQLAERLGIQLDDAYTRSTLLAMLAAKEATANTNMADGCRTGLISATTVGGMDATEQYYEDYLVSEAHRHFIPTHPCGYGTEQMARYLGVTDYVTTISTACSSAANAIMLGARMIRAGLLDRAIVGGTDCLSRFTINGF